MKRHRVQSTARARSQIQTISRWWSENRPLNPGLFRDELESAVERLAMLPGVGARYGKSEIPGVRRLLLGRTGYHVYYLVDEAKRLVTVLAVWHTARGNGPPLG